MDVERLDHLVDLKKKLLAHDIVLLLFFKSTLSFLAYRLESLDLLRDSDLLCVDDISIKLVVVAVIVF